MTDRKPLTSEEIFALVNRIADEFEAEDRAEIPPGMRWLIACHKSEAIRADLRDKLMEDFPELSLPEINMKVLRSLTPVRIAKNYTEPAYY